MRLVQSSPPPPPIITTLLNQKRKYGARSQTYYRINTTLSYVCVRRCVIKYVNCKMNGGVWDGVQEGVVVMKGVRVGVGREGGRERKEEGERGERGE